MTSELSFEAVRIIADAPGILQQETGGVASAELFVAVDVPKKSSGTDAHVPLRGVEPAAFRVRDGFSLLEGRLFEPGSNELIAGVAAVEQFEKLGVGSVKRWGESTWTVVGIFSTGGTAADSELWCDARVLQPAYRRGHSFQSVYAKLSDADSFAELEAALERDVRLEVDVMRQSDYYGSQSVILATTVRAIGGIFAVLMGVSATFAALNTMLTAVASRGREIATLRALGFGATPVVISVLTESVLLALVGGGLGGAAAHLLFHGYAASTMNWQTYSQVAFSFRVTPELLVAGVLYAALIGLIGGLVPALRAARLPIADALREG